MTAIEFSRGANKYDAQPAQRKAPTFDLFEVAVLAYDGDIAGARRVALDAVRLLTRGPRND